MLKFLNSMEKFLLNVAQINVSTLEGKTQARDSHCSTNENFMSVIFLNNSYRIFQETIKNRSKHKFVNCTLNSSYSVYMI